MKIYTRSGDKGQTSLFGGERVSKAHARVKAYGTLDELNSVMGICLAATRQNLNNAESGGQNSKPASQLEIDSQWLIQVQKDLFALGSWLASPEASERVARGEEAYSGDRQRKTHIDETRIEALEKMIDGWDADLPAMKSFILPGGGTVGAQVHLARTICRRAEREIVELQEQGEVVPDIAIVYLNRLADALFVFARWINQQTRQKEEPWT